MLRAWFGCVPAGMLAISAWLDVRGVHALLRAAVRVPPETTPAPPSAPMASSTRSASAIVARHPFEHIEPHPKVERHADARCERVRTTSIVASEESDWSFAVLVADDNRPVLRRRGQSWGRETVAFIGADRVWLTHEGSTCYVPLLGGSDAAGTETTRQTLAFPGIERRSASHFAVESRIVDHWLEDQREFVRSIRISPGAPGKKALIAVVQVLPGSVLQALGLEKGDRILMVNGVDIAEPEGALSTYARLRERWLDTWTVRIERGGKVMQLDYELR